MYKEYASKQFVEEYLKNQNISSVSAPDWNQNDESAFDYVKNRTHWAETEKVIVYRNWGNNAYTENLENVTLTFNNGLNDCSTLLSENAYLNPNCFLYPGRTYFVIWDGTEYEYVCQLKFDEDIGLHVLYIGAQDGTYPFYMEYNDTGTMIWSYSNGEQETGTTTHTLSLYEEIEIVHKLDVKYLPEFVINAEFYDDGREWYTPDVTMAQIAEAYYTNHLPVVLKITSVGGNTALQRYRLPLTLATQDNYAIHDVYIFECDDFAVKIVPADDSVPEGEAAIVEIRGTVASENAIIQSDWNQNDETAPDYIKNRTHYKTVTASDTLIITGLPQDVGYIPNSNVPFSLYKVSDTVLTAENCPNGISIAYMSEGGLEDMTLTNADIIASLDADGNGVLEEDQSAGIATLVNISVPTESYPAPEPGLYAIGINGIWIHKSITVIGSPIFINTIYTPLDKRYIPGLLIQPGEGSASEAFNGLPASAAAGLVSHAEGFTTTASGDYSHAEGRGTTASGWASHAEGRYTTASGDYSHAEGDGTTASGDYSHAEGDGTTASGKSSHAEGDGTAASGKSSHAAGYETEASGQYAHAEGWRTIASHMATHAEGSMTEASGQYAHAEGHLSKASGLYSHAEGKNAKAKREASHAEGSGTIASGDFSHAEGNSTEASGKYAHAEGLGTEASGTLSHVEGWRTIANSRSQHVQGEHNIVEGVEDGTVRGTYAHIVGNGIDTSTRSNAHTLDWEGNAWYAGDVYVGSTSGTNKDEGSVKLATVDEINAITEAKADWNQNDETAIDYVKNRTHWLDEVINGSSVIIPATTEAFVSGTDLDYGASLMYLVTVDGVEYQCEPYYNTDGGFCLGDSRLYMIFDDNGEEIPDPSNPMDVPFLANAYMDDNGGLGGDFGIEYEWYFYYPDDNTHTIEIASLDVSRTYHTLDDEYIPDTIYRKEEVLNLLSSNLSSKMENENPKGTGSFSMNRKSGTTIGKYSSTLGTNCTASGDRSHAEGRGTTASGDYSHAEGDDTTASGTDSHAEGRDTTASGTDSHAEGYSTTASGASSHAEGDETTASGTDSHAEGCFTIASEGYSHAEGYSTKASSECQHVQGKYNIEDTNGTYSHIVGNGTSDNARSNAHTLDWEGNAWFAGDVYVGSTSGTNKDEGSKILTTQEYVDIRVPAWTEADEGKFLRIVNGTPAWSTVTNTEEVRY